MDLRLNPNQYLLPPRPQPPTSASGLCLGLESHVEAEGLGVEGGSLPARPRLPLYNFAKTASQPRLPSPPLLYQWELFDFSTRRAKSKMSNKSSLGLPVPLLAPMVNGGKGRVSPQPLLYCHSHPPPRTPGLLQDSWDKRLSWGGEREPSLPHTHLQAESLGLALAASHPQPKKNEQRGCFLSSSF